MWSDISIHALLAESDHRRIRRLPRWADFYPRSPCGERRACLPARSVGAPISIHALLAESDRPHCYQQTAYFYFYPRSPCGERHILINTFTKIFEFLSTLSLRRATPGSTTLTFPGFDFYPRSPCGERHAASITPTASRNFYPRSPCGERQRYVPL